MKGFDNEIKQFNYGACELMLDALEDYLKGPEFLEIEQCEKLLKEKSAIAEKFVPIEELSTHGVDLLNVVPRGIVKTWQGRLNRWTRNGHRFIPQRFLSHEPVGIEFNANRYPIQLIHFHDTALMTNNMGTMGSLRHMDRRRYRQLVKRYKQLVKEYDKNHEAVEARWEQAGPYLKSEEFWSKYLELDRYAHGADVK